MLVSFLTCFWSNKSHLGEDSGVTYNFSAIGPPLLVELDIDPVLLSLLALAFSQDPGQGFGDLELASVNIAHSSSSADTASVLSSAVAGAGFVL